MGPGGAERCRLSAAAGSSREPLGGKAKDLKHGRRCGNHGEPSQVFSEGGVGMSERVSSGAGRLHTLELRSPQEQPEAQRDEVLLGRFSSPKNTTNQYY